MAEVASFNATLGAWPAGQQGVTFCVWAPHAEFVSVAGTFNNWNPAENPLQRTENGYWQGEVSNAAVGDEYRYVIRRGQQILWKVDPRAREVTTSQGNGVIVDPGQFDWGTRKFFTPQRQDLILYEMHVGSFTSDGGNPGTFATAAAKLPYLVELGVTGIQLMPVMEFPGGRSWGYDPAFPFAVETAYGGPTAFRQFVKSAHEHGLAVFLDVIYNHFGPNDLHLWRFDGWAPGRPSENRGGIYFYPDARSNTPWGARPNFADSEVRRYILDNVRMWFVEFHLDGLRVDGTYFMRTDSDDETGNGVPLVEGWSLLQEITARTATEFPSAWLIAEDMRDDPIITRPRESGGAGFAMQWCDWSAHLLRRPLPDSSETAEFLQNLQENFQHRYDDDPFSRVIYAESHDNAGKDGSLAANVDPEDARSDYARQRVALAAAAIMTAPGVPMLFQGAEFLSLQNFDVKQTVTLDWSQLDENRELFEFHRQLLALRQNRAGITGGLKGPNVRVLKIDAEQGLFAAHRWGHGGAGDDVLVIFRFSDREEPVSLPAPAAGRWHSRLPGFLGDLPFESLQTKGAPPQLTLPLPAWSVAILSQDPDQ